MCLLAVARYLIQNNADIVVARANTGANWLNMGALVELKRQMTWDMSSFS